MNSVKSGPTVPNWLAAGLIGIILGGAGGYYGARWTETPVGNGPGGMAASAGGGGGLAPPGGGMGGPGGGGAQSHPNAMALVRTVGNLAVLEKARGHELNPDQRQKISGITSELTAGGTLTEAQCEAHIQKINAVLTKEQQTVLEELTPRRGGGGGRRPGGPPAGGNGPGTLTPTSMGGGGAGMGGATGPDWERPFKEGRAKERLDELAGLLKK